MVAGLLTMNISLTPEQILEQCELGALVLPQFAPEAIAVQVGKHTGVCNCDRWLPEHVARFATLYWQRRLDFVWPGDFEAPPAFLNGKTRSSLLSMDRVERARLASTRTQIEERERTWPA